MRTFSKVVLFLAGAGVGAGVCYYQARATPASCQAEFATELQQAYGPTAERCEQFAAGEVARVQGEYSSVPATPGVAGPQDLRLEYVIAQKVGFNGLTFSDQASGKQGIVTKSDVFGHRSVGLQYEDLGQLLTEADATVPQPTTVKVYEAPKEK